MLLQKLFKQNKVAVCVYHYNMHAIGRALVIIIVSDYLVSQIIQSSLQFISIFGVSLIHNIMLLMFPFN